MRRKYKPRSKYVKKRKYKKIYGKGFFTGYANLLTKIIKKTV